MRRRLRAASIAAVGVAAVAAIPVLTHTSADAAPFTGGHLVVYRVGDGTGSLTNAAAPVFLDEYDASGAPVQSLPLPTVVNGANRALTASGQSRSEGQLTRSADGSTLALTGYDAAPGTTGPSGASLTASAPSSVARVVGLVDSTGAIDTRIALTGADAPYVVRSAVTDSGDRVWVAGGNGGVLTTTAGSSAATVVAGGASSNLGGLTIQAGQLWSSGLVTNRLTKVGAGLPTSGASFADLPVAATLNTTTGLPKNLLTSGYALLDLTNASYSGTGVDTLYLANGSERGGTIDKYSFDGTSWQRSGYVDVPGAFGLVADRNGSAVSLAVSTPRKLVTLSDPDGASAGFAPTAPATLVTAAAGTELRGVALAPVALPDPTISVNGPANNAAITLGSAGVPVSVTASGATALASVKARLGSGAIVALTHGAGDLWTGTLPLAASAPGTATVTITATDSDSPARTKTVTRAVRLVLPAGTTAAGRKSWAAAPVTKSGGWAAYATSLSPNSRSLVSGTKGSWSQVKLYGRAVTLTFTTRKDSGIAYVYVDGRLVSRQSLYSRTTSSLSRTWSFSANPLKVHTVKVVVSGTKVAKSKGKRVYLGAFRVS